MRGSGAILLVACYELGHQPLNLASPLAFLERAGYSPVAVDTAVAPLSDTAIRAARLVAISVPMHTALRLGVRVVERVRRVNPQAHITLYGLYAWLNQGFLLPERVDSIIAGEYEGPLLALAEAMEQGLPLRTVAGVGLAGHGARPYIGRLPFPVPNRAALPPLDRYAHFRQEETLALAGYVEASRGCLHRCRHCPITPVYGGRFVVVPPDVVLADIAAQVAAGARHITFGDPDFLNGPGHALKIVRAMHEAFPALTFDATIKIEHILEQRAILPELRRLGCAFIVSAVESFSDVVLAHLAKGHSAADIGEALAITRAAGIVLRPSFVAFTPWTTLDDFVAMLDAVERYGMVEQVDPVQYSIRLLVPPGSALLGEGARPAWVDDLDAAAFTFRWQHPDPRMDALHGEVAALVEAAASRDAPLAETFYRVKERAYALAGLPAPDLPAPMLAAHAAPGLTESWFC